MASGHVPRGAVRVGKETCHGGVTPEATNADGAREKVFEGKVQDLLDKQI